MAGRGLQGCLSVRFQRVSASELLGEGVLFWYTTSGKMDLLYFCYTHWMTWGYGYMLVLVLGYKFSIQTI